MNSTNLSMTDKTAHDGTPVRLVYDQEADILEIFFGTNEPATGVELTDHIILRLNQQIQASPTERVPLTYVETQPSMAIA